MTDKIYINWEEFHQDVKQLSKKIKQSGEYDKIVAISRGGLLPAGILAYELDIRNSAVVNCSTYFDAVQTQMERIEHPEHAGLVDEKTLIVDDLSDSGQTLRVLRHDFPQAKYVTVYTKSKGKSVVDIYTRELPDQWIVFPWDL